MNQKQDLNTGSVRVTYYPKTKPIEPEVKEHGCSCACRSTLREEIEKEILQDMTSQIETEEVEEQRVENVEVEEHIDLKEELQQTIEEIPLPFSE